MESKGEPWVTVRNNVLKSSSPPSRCPSFPSIVFNLPYFGGKMFAHIFALGPKGLGRSSNPSEYTHAAFFFLFPMHVPAIDISGIAVSCVLSHNLAQQWMFGAEWAHEWTVEKWITLTGVAGEGFYISSDVYGSSIVTEVYSNTRYVLGRS